MSERMTDEQIDNLCLGRWFGSTHANDMVAAGEEIRRARTIESSQAERIKELEAGTMNTSNEVVRLKNDIIDLGAAHDMLVDRRNDIRKALAKYDAMPRVKMWPLARSGAWTERSAATDIDDKQKPVTFLCLPEPNNEVEKETGKPAHTQGKATVDVDGDAVEVNGRLLTTCNNHGMSALQREVNAFRLARGWNCLPAFDAMREALKEIASSHEYRCSGGPRCDCKVSITRAVLSLADESEKT